MDVLGGVIARLDGPAPRWADRLRWRRGRRHDAALRVVDALVSRGDVVLDIGAMRGLFSSRMLDLVGAGGFVHAFEPNPAHRDRLRSLDRRGRLSVHSVAVSDHAGEATLRVPVLDGRLLPGLASVEKRPAGQTQELAVPIVRLDDVLDADPQVSFIKCDVEGHEDAVIAGAGRVLRSRPAVLIEIEQRHRATDVSNAFAAFGALGYEGWALSGTGLRPLDEFDVQRDQLAFLAGARADGLMPAGYVHNFLFATPGTDVSALLGPTG